MAIYGMLIGTSYCTRDGATECFVAGQSAEADWEQYKLFAGILLTFFLIINCLGVEFLGRSQVILTLGMIGILVVFGSAVCLHRKVRSQRRLRLLLLAGQTLHIDGGAITATILALNTICSHVEESQSEKNVPRARSAVLVFHRIAFGQAILCTYLMEHSDDFRYPQHAGAEAMYGEAGMIALGQCYHTCLRQLCGYPIWRCSENALWFGKRWNAAKNLCIHSSAFQNTMGSNFRRICMYVHPILYRS